jgi:hypothetical protein
VKNDKKNEKQVYLDSTVFVTPFVTKRFKSYKFVGEGI